jgi:ethanolamine utilization protein EutN
LVFSGRITRADIPGARSFFIFSGPLGWLAISIMILGRIVGTVVSTRKDPRLDGKTLLIVKPVTPEGVDEAGYLVAIDTVAAGFRETVLVVSGSSARMATECKERPVDAAIVGIVDSITLDALHEADLAAARGNK